MKLTWLKNATKSAAKNPWLYTLGVSVASIINSHHNAAKGIGVESKSARALNDIARALVKDIGEQK